MNKTNDMSKAPIRGWLEPKPPMKLPSKPVAYVAANQSSTSSLTSHGKSQQRNYSSKPVSEQYKQATPTHKIIHVRPQQYQSNNVPKPQTNKTHESKPAAMQNKVVQNKTRNTVIVNNIIVQNLKHLNLNTSKSTNHTYKKPVTSQTASGSKPKPKTTTNQNFSRRRPINNNGCVVNVTNNFINRK